MKNESTGSVRQATTDTDGRFSVTSLPEGLYTIEASAPSFAKSRRTGVKLAAGGTENVSMALNVGELSQSITVEGSVSVAAELAPSQSTLDARSAKSEISPEFIQNFASPIADLYRVAPNG